MESSLILYQDDTVRITRDELRIFKYYYPVPVDRTIEIKNIESLHLKTDMQKNLQYIEVKSTGLHVNGTFSPRDPNKVFQVLEAETLLRRDPQCMDTLVLQTSPQSFETGQTSKTGVMGSKPGVMGNVVYEDETVRITREEIRILKYYYPIEVDRNIRIEDIESVTYRTDFEKNQRFIEVKAKGFHANGTFRPKDPARVMQVLEGETGLRKDPMQPDTLTRQVNPQFVGTGQSGQSKTGIKGNVLYEDQSVRITR